MHFNEKCDTISSLIPANLLIDVMTLITMLHQSDTVNWTPEHRSLRIFDFHNNAGKSRIPVLVNRSSAVTKKSENQEKTGRSKIPVYKPIGDRSSETIAPNIPAPKKRSHSLEETQVSDFVRKSKKTVKLHGLELTSVPPEIFDRNDLEILILSPERESCLDFKLPFLPSAVGHLTQLRILVLDTNELQEIPNEVENLCLLEKLILGNNNLSTLPRGLSNLTRLRSLHLANNNFDDIPLVICNIVSLGFLDMSDNLIRFIPPEISNLAGTLHTLLLLMNEIEFLPKSFSQLISLTCLWLGENKLKELPDDFGELYQLEWGSNLCSSNIDGNPLERPPVEICRKGPLEIRKFFHRLRSPTSDKKLSPTSTNRIPVKTLRKYKMI